MHWLELSTMTMLLESSSQTALPGMSGSEYDELFEKRKKISCIRNWSFSTAGEQQLWRLFARTTLHRAHKLKNYKIWKRTAKKNFSP